MRSFTLSMLLLGIVLLHVSPLIVAQDVNLVPFVESVNIVTEAFEESHCAVQEGSLGNEISRIPQRWNGVINRRLLRFSVGIENKGTTDLRVNREDNPQWFEWGQCHRHWHMRDFTNYELIDNQNGRDVVTGRKQAFCLMDIRRVERFANPQARHGCANPGISAGWADIYSYTLDGQWIDVTEVPSGYYTLRVTVNYGGMIRETNYADNSVMVRQVFIPPAGAEYRSGGANPATCEPIYSGCGSNQDCCTEICMHQSGEVKTSPGSFGGQCVCAQQGQRCGGDQNCCTGQCDIRTNMCVAFQPRPTASNTARERPTSNNGSANSRPQRVTSPNNGSANTRPQQVTSPTYDGFGFVPYLFRWMGY